MKIYRIIRIICTILVIVTSLQIKVSHAIVISATSTPGFQGDLLGLEWLSLDETVGMSRSAVENGTLVTDDGWRFATRSEAETMITSLWGGTISGWSSNNAVGALSFINTFMATQILPNTLSLFGSRSSLYTYGEEGACSANTSATCYADIGYFDNNLDNKEAEEVSTGNVITGYTGNSGAGGHISEFFGADLGLEMYGEFNDTVLKNASIPGVSSLLVRSAPAPAPFIILGLGLVCVIGTTRLNGHLGA